VENPDPPSQTEGWAPSALVVSRSSETVCVRRSMVRGRTNQEGIRATHLEKFKSPRRRSDVWGTRQDAGSEIERGAHGLRHGKKADPSRALVGWVAGWGWGVEAICGGLRFGMTVRRRRGAGRVKIHARKKTRVWHTARRRFRNRTWGTRLAAWGRKQIPHGRWLGGWRVWGWGVGAICGGLRFGMTGGGGEGGKSQNPRPEKHQVTPTKAPIDLRPRRALSHLDSKPNYATAYGRAALRLRSALQGEKRVGIGIGR